MSILNGSLVAFGSTLLAFLAHRFAPVVYGKIRALVALKVLATLDTQDENDRALIRALVLWAEAKIPERGKGNEKFQLVTGILSKIGLPPAYAETVEGIIEETVESMRDGLEDAVPGSVAPSEGGTPGRQG